MRELCIVVSVSVFLLVGCTSPATLTQTPIYLATVQGPGGTANPTSSAQTGLDKQDATPDLGGVSAFSPIPTSDPPLLDGSESILDTSLGQAIQIYNSINDRRIVVHVVSSESEGLDQEMYEDLSARGWRMMGPEDFAGSIEKPGWPYVVIALEDTLNANTIEVWGYVLEHEYVHMVAAENLALEGINLAEVMRGENGVFTHRARFHEVCADYYPLDAEGNHRPVAEFYGAMPRMTELLDVLAEYSEEDLEYISDPNLTILPITGISLLDAACVWDREAMERVRTLFDARRGDGSFDILFPVY